MPIQAGKICSNSVDDTELEYDANGNVILYGDREFTWTYGRSLASVLDGMDEYTYTYDENGIRTSKTVDSVTTYFDTKYLVFSVC